MDDPDSVVVKMSFILKGKPYIPGMQQYIPPKMREEPPEPEISGPVEPRSALDEMKELIAELTFDEMLEWSDAVLNCTTDINTAFTLAVALNSWAKNHNRQKGE